MLVGQKYRRWKREKAEGSKGGAMRGANRMDRDDLSHDARPDALTALMAGLMVCAVAPRPALARVWYVYSGQTTIQAAIDGAQDGDEILVGNGLYAGPGNREIDFRGKAISVRSMNGPGRCLIWCQRQGRGFYFHSGEGPSSVLDGFAIAWGKGKFGGGGIFCYSDSNPTIRNCIIADNSTNTLGGGIRCCSSSPTITNCVISGNSAGFFGGGIYCGGNDRGLTSNPLIQNCLFYGNSASDLGGAIHCGDQSAPIIVNCTITDNTAIHAGGISCWSDSNPLLVNSILWGNHATKSRSLVFLPGPMISGHVRDINGRGVANIDVTTGNIVGKATTDEHGYYEVLQYLQSTRLPTDDQRGAEIAVADDSSTLATSYCVIEGGPTHAYIATGSELIWGHGNLDTDPEFLDPGSRDYHITSESPCVNAGDPSSDCTGQTDLESQDRIMGGRVDIGADEYLLSPPALTQSIPPMNGVLPKMQNNVIRLVFDGPIFLPAGYPVRITPLEGGDDLASSFTFSLEPTNPSDPSTANRVLKCTERDLSAGPDSGVLTDGTWYRIEPARNLSVASFALDVYTLRGDIDGDGKVLIQDLAMAYGVISESYGAETDEPEDLDGDGLLLWSDLIVIGDHYGNERPAKPETEGDQDETPDGDPNDVSSTGDQSLVAASGASAAGCGALVGSSQLVGFWALCWVGLIGLARWHRHRR